MSNAAAIAQNLVNIENGGIGATLGSAPNGTSTTAMPTVNSLANMLATCVHDAGNCASLVKYATSPAGTPPRDTLAAMVNIAHYPGQNVAELLTLSTVEPVYSPALKSDASDNPEDEGFVNSFVLTNNWLLDAFRNPENPGGHQVVVFIGLAGPVATPLLGPPRQPR